jgi:hypothetical protein
MFITIRQNDKADAYTPMLANDLPQHKMRIKRPSNSLMFTSYGNPGRFIVCFAAADDLGIL